MQLKFYSDSTLTVPIDSSVFTMDREIGGDPVDKQIWLGSTDDTTLYEADDGSGVITVGITDATAATGWDSTDLTLALTQADLDTATAGAPVSVADPIQGGITGAQPIWIRFSGTSSTPVTYDDLGLTTNTVREYQS